MNDIIVNYWAVLLASLSSMALGFLWYSPALFGTKWAKLGKIEVGKGGATSGYIIGFVSSLIISYILAHFIQLTAAGFGTPVTIQSAISTAFWAWLGFFATVATGEITWEMKPWGYWFIVAGYWLIALVLMAAIIGGMQ